MKKLIYPMLGFSVGVFVCYFIWLLVNLIAGSVVTNTTMLFTGFLAVGLISGYFSMRLAKKDFTPNKWQKALLIIFALGVVVYLGWFLRHLNEVVDALNGV